MRGPGSALAAATQAAQWPAAHGQQISFRHKPPTASPVEVHKLQEGCAQTNIAEAMSDTDPKGDQLRGARARRPNKVPQLSQT